MRDVYYLQKSTHCWERNWLTVHPPGPPRTTLAGAPGSGNTCGVHMQGTVFLGNSAGHGGSQVYSMCGGAMNFTSSNVTMGGGNEVRRAQTFQWEQ